MMRFLAHVLFIFLLFFFFFFRKKVCLANTSSLVYSENNKIKFRMSSVVGQLANRWHLIYNAAPTLGQRHTNLTNSRENKSYALTLGHRWPNVCI